MGVPLHHNFSGIFPYKPSSYGGTPIDGPPQLIFCDFFKWQPLSLWREIPHAESMTWSYSRLVQRCQPRGDLDVTSKGFTKRIELDPQTPSGSGILSIKNERFQIVGQLDVHQVLITPNVVPFVHQKWV